MKKIFLSILALAFFIELFCQVLTPLEVDNQSKSIFEAIMLPQIENRYFYKEKILSYYAVSDHPSYQPFVNLAAKTESGEIYYFSWIYTHLAPELIGAKPSARTNEGVELALQKKKESEIKRSLKFKNQAVNIIDSLGLIFMIKIDSTILITANKCHTDILSLIPEIYKKNEMFSNRIDYNLDSLKYYDEQSLFFINYLADSLKVVIVNDFTEQIKNETDSIITAAIEDIQREEIFHYCSEDELNNIKWETLSKFEHIESSINSFVYSLYYQARDTININISNNNVLKSDYVKSCKESIATTNALIHQINTILLTMKFKKKDLQSFTILLEEKFPNLPATTNNIIYFIENHRIPRSEIKPYLVHNSIYQLDNLTAIPIDSELTEELLLKNEELYKMYNYIYNYLP